MQNLSTCDCEYNKAGKIEKYLATKDCSCEERLIRELVLECEGEILNAAETIKMEHAKRNNCLVHTILLVITCLLLVVGVSISGYYHYTADWMQYKINIK